MYRSFWAASVLSALWLSACSSDPEAPINQTTPIRQMDRFFNGLSGREAPPPPPIAVEPGGYANRPGYAPAYPQYETLR